MYDDGRRSAVLDGIGCHGFHEDFHSRYERCCPYAMSCYVTPRGSMSSERPHKASPPTIPQLFSVETIESETSDTLLLLLMYSLPDLGYLYRYNSIPVDEDIDGPSACKVNKVLLRV